MKKARSNTTLEYASTHAFRLAHQSQALGLLLSLTHNAEQENNPTGFPGWENVRHRTEDGDLPEGSKRQVELYTSSSPRTARIYRRKFSSVLQGLRYVRDTYGIPIDKTIWMRAARCDGLVEDTPFGRGIINSARNWAAPMQKAVASRVEIPELPGVNWLRLTRIPKGFEVRGLPGGFYVRPAAES